MRKAPPETCSERQRRLARQRRERRERTLEPPPVTVADRWLNAEAIDAAIALSEYFKASSYGHAGNLASLP